jgi:hypothetical protein
VFDFMPNQNGLFLSYLMLVPVFSSQYKFLTAASDYKNFEKNKIISTCIDYPITGMMCK